VKPSEAGICSAKTLDAFLSLVDACHAVSSQQSFSGSVYPVLQTLMPHDRFVCGIAMLQTASVARVINFGFPPGYARQQISADGRIHSPLIRSWLSNRVSVPVFFDARNSVILRTASDWAWNDVLVKNGIHNLAAHGLLDVSGLAMTYFCFAGVQAEQQELDATLRLIVPHLHIAVMQEHINSPDNVGLSLSTREADVLKLVCQGKTNNDIASILGISAWTVKIHVRNFMSKLGVATRAQAAAIAIKHGLVR
jgi:DNA-binding CsgD family transcriptional regulator